MEATLFGRPVAILENFSMFSGRWKAHLKRYFNLFKAYIGAFLVRFVLRLILMTCRFTFVDRCGFAERSKKGNCVLLVWHNRLTLVHHFLFERGGPNLYTAVVSASRDGLLLSGMTLTNPYARVIQVAARKRHAALREMVRSLQRDEVLLVTPDGPRGPRYQVKSGSLYAAKSTGAEIIPFSYTASKFWQLRSWDKMIIPKPFSRIVVGVGEPLSVDGVDLDNESEGSRISRALCEWDETLCATLTEKKELWPQ